MPKEATDSALVLDEIQSSFSVVEPIDIRPSCSQQMSSLLGEWRTCAGRGAVTRTVIRQQQRLHRVKIWRGICCSNYNYLSGLLQPASEVSLRRAAKLGWS